MSPGESANNRSSVKFDTQIHAILTGFPIDPEGDPAHDDEQGSGSIDFDDKASHQALEVERDNQPRVGSSCDTE